MAALAASESAAAPAVETALEMGGASADAADLSAAWVLSPGGPPAAAAAESMSTLEEDSSDEEDGEGETTPSSPSPFSSSSSPRRSGRAAPAAPSPAALAAMAVGKPTAAPGPASTQAPTPSKPSPSAARPADALDIVFVGAEAAPYSKTGGLGDVMGSLPPALAARGHRVMVVAPRYLTGGAGDAAYAKAVDTGVTATLDLGRCGPQEVGFHHEHRAGVDWVFVSHPAFNRAGTPYCDTGGTAFGDNQFRFALLSLAACEAPLILPIGGFRDGTPPGFPYGQKIAWVANDWHAGLVPLYLAHRYRPHGVYADARCLLAIHNLSHQGVEPAATFDTLGLPGSAWDDLSWRYPEWAQVKGEAVNLLKGAALASDRVVAVSAGYAWEVQTPEGGWGLDGVLQSRASVINGITNGIDEGEWDPAADPHLAPPYAAFSPSDMRGKAACKAALQAELGLPVDPAAPLVVWIGRLDHQKGPDLVLEAAPGLAARGIQTVMLGSGSAELEGRMRAAEAAHPAHFRGWVGFSVPLAHRLTAGGDVLLMPSRFEPCGLNQLYAMRYGTLPVAHATGGLRDTVIDAGGAPGMKDQKTGSYEAAPANVGTGWTFAPPETVPMLRALDAALHTQAHEPARWAAMQAAAMGQDLSWDRAAGAYEQVMRWAALDGAVRGG